MLLLEKVRSIIKKYKNNKIIIPLTLLMIGIIFLLIIQRNGDDVKVHNTSDQFSLKEYVSSLEHNLENNIKLLDNVTDCSVMLTISSVDNNEYLENQNISSTLGDETEEYSKQREYLVIEESGDDKVVIKSRETPKICGALVVYEGSADVLTKKNILDAVSTVLGIQSNRVFVVSNSE